MKMKPAICEKCGKRLPGVVPSDAEHVTCFACCEKENIARDRKAVRR